MGVPRHNSSVYGKKRSKEKSPRADYDAIGDPSRTGLASRATYKLTMGIPLCLASFRLGFVHDQVHRSIVVFSLVEPRLSVTLAAHFPALFIDLRPIWVNKNEQNSFWTKGSEVFCSLQCVVVNGMRGNSECGAICVCVT